MNMNQLAFFKAMYERRNYTAVARSIPMSRQGLVKSLASLEQELEVPLFEASSTGNPVATKYADALYSFSTQMLELNETMLRQLARIKQEERTIRLCASTGVLGFLGAGFLGRFRELYSDIDVIQDELPDLHCEDGLRDGDYDLAITVNPFINEFETIPMYLNDRYARLARHDPLAKKTFARDPRSRRLPRGSDGASIQDIRHQSATRASGRPR